MTEAFNTIRASVDSTLSEFDSVALDQDLFSKVTSEWAQAKDANLVDAVRKYPHILGERSVLLDLAIEEYKQVSATSGEVELERHCARFGAFGKTLQESIFRQLETQRFLDKHPELMDFVRQPEWPEPVEQLGEFHVLEELGRGSLSRVYLCRDESLGNRQVVVKVKPYEDFEASILGGLDHPHVMPIHSTGSFEDRHISFLCMPFCGRSTLIDVIDKAFGEGRARTAQAVAAAATQWAEPSDRTVTGADSPRLGGRWAGTYVDAVLRLALPLAEALAHAHRAGVVHGDLKPSNVLLTPQGKPVLFDFNLSQSSLAEYGPRGGTLPYMPPEQLGSLVKHRSGPTEPPRFDVRSDVYSFGAVLYELLMGSVPFSIPPTTAEFKPAARALLEQQRRGAASLRDGDRLIGPRLDALVRSCLAVVPDERPKSMEEVARALRQEAGLAGRVSRAARARPKRAAALVLAVCLTVAAPAGYYATLPPMDVRALQAAREARSEGRLDDAVGLMNTVVRANPSYENRFERARALMEAERLDEAISKFTALEKESGDPVCFALLGYCFSLKKVHLVSVAAYEKAIRGGYENAAVHNNLGVAYRLASRPQATLQESLTLAHQHLTRALEYDTQSRTIMLNLAHTELQVLLADAYSETITPLQIERLVRELPLSNEVSQLAAISFVLLVTSDNAYADRAMDAVERALEMGGADKTREIRAIVDSHEAPTGSAFQRLARLMTDNNWPARDGQIPVFLDPLSDP